MKKILIMALVLTIVSCKNEKTQEVYNPFATPEGCVWEYLEARDSCDIKRMLNCFSYEAKFERIIIEGLQKDLDDRERDKKYRSEEYHEMVDSVKLKDTYPNSAVVTVYTTYGYKKTEYSSWHYDLNLVKDNMNWKLEAQLSYSITSN